LALPVENIELAKKFYCEQLGFEKGREDSAWVDINFFGHQLVFHQGPKLNQSTSHVDSHEVPIPHFGCVLEWNQWHELKEKLIKLETEFILNPYIRFEGQPGEQATMFFLDPNKLALEFKAFRDINQLFEK